jgi:hypothetical protein
MSTHYDEGLAPCNTTVIQDRHAPATYGHADLRLWRTDIDDSPEHDYLDDTAFVDEHIDRAQSGAIEYQEDSVQFFEETIDDDLESLDSEYYYEVPTHDEIGWEEGYAEQHDAPSDYQTQDAELAMFWQPNRLY